MEGGFSYATNLLVAGDIDFLSSSSDVEVKSHGYMTCDYDMSLVKRRAKW